MRYLLDTHAALWFLAGDDRLSVTAKAVILDPSTEISISVASSWELAIKLGLRKLQFEGGIPAFFDMVDDNGFTLLPLTKAHLNGIAQLPLHHRNPFDRLLVATAFAESMSLVTADTAMALYGVSRVW
ncbi:MAG: type II toxin-antitoxin system VapC family toxin [Azoarcus sp.]|jgi:PIN domain nuclease of toxin-antitoxin system|nr:type II toxin-antitoxin system VapC family toxin [Azoarcus sp.]